MATAPYGVRLLVGAAVTALEETRRLPQTILMYPMTVASQIAQLVMKMQQDVADLVIKGDEALETLFPPKDEQPEWATFDDELDTGEDADSGADVVNLPVRDGERLTEGRFALFSGEPETSNNSSSRETASSSVSSSATDTVPDIVAELDYEDLTLAQLRARLTSLRVPDLEALLAYEESTKARAPFQTLLANRITRASAK
ncbi:lipid droplet-associated protein [Mycolicibacterium sp. CR10]|uniref:lipid droplet-associated protein n=1 Tax=Mycolicibacterium sp. CR10 TaxID=2562314 RepID=UPI0010C093FA|nr:lipid droplet-associated protein [Mycolicibacterium sp. CR10]